MSELELYMQRRYGYYALMIAGILEDEHIRYWIREKNVEWWVMAQTRFDSSQWYSHFR